jgi:hypothetical protein
VTAAFNEANRYLIEHWADAHDLVLGVEATRKKYERLLEEVLAELRQRDWWDRDFKGWSSAEHGIGFGRKSWDVTNHEHHFPGLWMDNIELDHLLTDHEDRPKAYVWIGPLKDAGHDIQRVKRTILKRAASVLRRSPKRSSENEVDIISYIFPEGRKELERALTQNRSRPFIDLLAKHADRLSEFIPAFDEALRRRPRK